MNNIDDQIKGTLEISMETDGDFGFHNLENIKKEGWKVSHDEDSYDYTFCIDFEGDRYELASKVSSIFEEIHTRKTYIMKNICNVFEEIEANCKSDDMKPAIYIDHGNQTYEASFEFGKVSHLNAYKRLLKSKEEVILHYEECIKELKKEVEMAKAEIAKMEE